MKRKEFFSAKRVTGMAVLLALVIVLQLLGGYFKIGATSLSFVLVPIVLGGILYGSAVGAFLGFAFGFITLLYGITGADPFTAILFQEQPLVTILLCIGKGTLSGFVAGVMYKEVAKKSEYGATYVSAITAPVVNTGLFIFGCLCFLKETLQTHFVAEGTTLVYFLFIGCAGINFLVELAINVIASPTVYRVMKIVNGKGKGSRK